MDKRGQFYLIAALIILTLATGFVIISNKASSVSNYQIQGLKEEIRLESSNIIDYAAYKNLGNSETESMLTNLSNYYINNSQNGNFYFIIGTQSSFVVRAYQRYAENVSIGGIAWDLGVLEVVHEKSDSGDSIDIKINGTSFSFKINRGENFHFVVSSLNKGQKYVITG